MQWRVAFLAAVVAAVVQAKGYKCDTSKCQICTKLPLELKELEQMCRGAVGAVSEESLAKLPPCSEVKNTTDASDANSEAAPSEEAAFLQMPKCLPSGAASFLELSTAERSDYLANQCIKRAMAAREVCAKLILGKCCHVSLDFMKSSGLLCEGEKHSLLGCAENAYCINYNRAATPNDCVCNQGYEGDGTICNPAPACKEGSCHKDATCAPSAITFGEVGCTCNAGFKGDGTQCSEINPCEEVSGSKHYHNCDTNAKCSHSSPGQHRCICRFPDWFGDGKTCARDNPCAVGNGGCDGQATCKRTAQGERTCSCNTHYVGDGLTCKAYDYCTSNNGGCDLHADCTPLLGNVTCKCKVGYSGDGHSCTSLDPCVLLPNGGCSSLATCKSHVPGQRTCTCKPGYEGDGVSCEMKNACAENHCGKNALCMPVGPGAANCSCFDGYVMSGKDGCVARDACSLVPNGGCSENAQCTQEVAGTRSCKCNRGFSGDGVSCKEKNDCEKNNGGCDKDAKCSMVSGSKRCSCNSGFTGSGSTCTLTENCPVGVACKDDNAICVNGTCACKDGYSGNGNKCAAIDACIRVSENEAPCHLNAKCDRSAPGVKVCKCDAGYAGDGYECQPIDACVDGLLSGKGCGYTGSICTPTPGLSKPFKCSCKPGYAGKDGTCQPIMACATNNGGCSENAQCSYGGPGLATCTCNQHFSGTGVTCNLLDYCLANNGGCHSDAKCTSGASGAVCSCNPGFTGDGHRCTQISPCDGNPCSNAPGTYCEATAAGAQCKCKPGYNLKSGGVKSVTCTPINVCQSKANSNGGCALTATCSETGPGTRSCTCNTGYRGDGFKCTEINNCNFNNGGCNDNSVCIMTAPGSNTCRCKDGYMSASRPIDDVSVEDLLDAVSPPTDCVPRNPCREFSRGGCSQNATCVYAGIPGVAKCVCDKGFSGFGDACELINKCETNNGGCDSDATCEFSPVNGSSCSCNKGYVGDGFTCTDTGSCPLLPDGTTGCHMNAKCQSVMGGRPVCHCKQGFEGDGKAICDPINLCDKDHNDCDEFATCYKSSPGKAGCKCNSGFHGDGKACKPTDQCAFNHGGCSQHAFCNMTAPGRHVCACMQDYTGDGYECRPIDSCTINNGGCSSNARCVSTTPNRNRCVCNDNFMGDAYAVDGCNEINFCSKNNGGCDVNANCAPKFNGAGDVECRCKDGYGGSNPYIQGGCVPYTSCTASKCGANSQCVNVSNAFAEPAASADFKAVDKPCVCKAGAGGLNGMNCKVCPAGLFKVGMGNAECQKCPPGTMSGEGAKECIRCAAGTFATGGSSMCEKCPPGTTSGRGAKECRAETERVCIRWKWTALRALNDTLGLRSFKYEWFTCKDVLKSQPHTYERWAAGRHVEFWVGGNNCGATTTAAFCMTTGPNGENIFEPKLPGGFTVAANVFCDKDWWAKMYFCDEFNNIAPAVSNQIATASNVSAVGK